MTRNCRSDGQGVEIRLRVRAWRSNSSNFRSSMAQGNPSPESDSESTTQKVTGATGVSATVDGRDEIPSSKFEATNTCSL